MFSVIVAVFNNFNLFNSIFEVTKKSRYLHTFQYCKYTHFLDTNYSVFYHFHGFRTAVLYLKFRIM